MRKLLINLVMLILAFTIQICVFPQIAFLSSAPNLLLIVVFVCSFIEGRERGMFYGLVAGLFMDLFYSGPFGCFLICFCSLCFLEAAVCRKCQRFQFQLDWCSRKTEIINHKRPAA